MANFSKSSLKSVVLLLSLVIAPAFLPAQPSSPIEVESLIQKSIENAVSARSVTVQLIAGTSRSSFRRLAVKIDGAEIGHLTADRMTVLLENPLINVPLLQQSQKLEIANGSDAKVSILISAESLEQYLQRKAQQFNKRNVNITLKFTPPYIECFYDVPKDEVAPESVALLKKFIPGDRIEGYAAFQISVRDNMLSATSSKVITNHMLLPGPLLRAFESKFNPFDEVPTVGPFQYRLRNLNVQAKYIYMAN